MEVKVIEEFIDKKENVLRKLNEVFETTEERGMELINKKVVIEEKKKETTKTISEPKVKNNIKKD